MVFMATDGDTDTKTSSFHQSRKLIPSSQSIAICVGLTATAGICYSPEIILYELKTQATL